MLYSVIIILYFRKLYVNSVNIFDIIPDSLTIKMTPMCFSNDGQYYVIVSYIWPPVLPFCAFRPSVFIYYSLSRESGQNIESSHAVCILIIIPNYYY